MTEGAALQLCAWPLPSPSRQFRGEGGSAFPVDRPPSRVLTTLICFQQMSTLQYCSLYILHMPLQDAGADIS